MSAFETLREVYNRGNFVVLDTETTGFDSGSEIIQIAITDSEGKTLIDTLVKNLHPIPPSASRVHGLYAADLVDAPSWMEVRAKCMALMAGKDVIIYNKGYDTALLRYSDAHNGIKENDWSEIKFYCAMLAYAEHRGEWNDYRGSYKWHKLTDAMVHQKLKVDNAHAAIGDCLMTLALINKMYAPLHSVQTFDDVFSGLPSVEFDVRDKSLNKVEKPSGLLVSVSGNLIPLYGEVKEGELILKGVKLRSVRCAGENSYVGIVE